MYIVVLLPSVSTDTGIIAALAFTVTIYRTMAAKINKLLTVKRDHGTSTQQH